MELKIFINSNFTKVVFYCWWSIGKVFGLFPFYYNKSKEVYCQSLISQLYSAFIGCLAISCFPYAFTRYYEAINVIDKSIELPFIISVFNDWYMFVFMVIIYFLQLYNNKMLVNFYNDFARCAERFDAKFPEFSETKCIYGYLFTVAVFLKTAKIFQYAIGLTFISRQFKFRILMICIINFPLVVSAIVTVQFFLGVLFLWCYLNKVSKKLECVRTSQVQADLHINTSNFEAFKNHRFTLELSETLDLLGRVYETLYLLYQKLDDFFSIQMMFMLGQIFVSLVMQIFFQFLWILYFITGILPVIVEMQITGIMSIIFLIYELKIYFYVSGNCTKEV